MSKPLLIDEFQRVTNNSPMLTDGEKKEFILEYQRTEDPEIAQLLLESHYKLIIKIASNARREFEKVDIRDLIQNGVIGFMEGIRKYDETKRKDSKVTSYLFLWVREYINREIKFCYSEVKVPEWQLRLARAVDNEVALNKIDIVEAVNRISERTEVSVDKINKILLNKVSLAPISKPVDPSGETDISYENFIEDQSSYQPDEIMKSDETNIVILNIIENDLNDRERFALIHNFGLWGNEKMTLEQIGECLNITKMAVCHIVKKALKKLRKIKDIDINE
jgi:RNA polymerase sigma factor (sigma-70 family)